MPSIISEIPLEKQIGKLCKQYRTHKDLLTQEMIKKLDDIDEWYWNLYEHLDVSLEKLQEWVRDAHNN